MTHGRWLLTYERSLCSRLGPQVAPSSSSSIWQCWTYTWNWVPAFQCNSCTSHQGRGSEPTTRSGQGVRIRSAASGPPHQQLHIAGWTWREILELRSLFSSSPLLYFLWVCHVTTGKHLTDSIPLKAPIPLVAFWGKSKGPASMRAGL
jgi:hypothetical protein